MLRLPRFARTGVGGNFEMSHPRKIRRLDSQFDLEFAAVVAGYGDEMLVEGVAFIVVVVLITSVISVPFLVWTIAETISDRRAARRRKAPGDC